MTVKCRSCLTEYETEPRWCSPCGKPFHRYLEDSEYLELTKGKTDAVLNAPIIIKGDDKLVCHRCNTVFKRSQMRDLPNSCRCGYVFTLQDHRRFVDLKRYGGGLVGGLMDAFEAVTDKAASVMVDSAMTTFKAADAAVDVVVDTIHFSYQGFKKYQSEVRLVNEFRNNPPLENSAMKPFYASIESMDEFILETAVELGIDPLSYKNLRIDTHLLYKFKHHYCYTVYQIGWMIGYHGRTVTPLEDRQLSNIINELVELIRGKYTQLVVNVFLQYLEEALIAGIAMGFDYKHRGL
ncbi:hypothetical protein [Paenibacillus tepidiphilus]|uniref:hypothetical protein n=1 Tax=Paenibacillus tepidiphilus TaxID=2608683 RepID=UPI00123AFEF9|nr:hypothetical protein [Paenibacillus tepidiphilus]